jgi:hypothetical protein
MNIQTTEGKDINLLASGDIIITRKLVSVENGVYFVCKSDEFTQARKEGREPVCIGFRREYVVER